MESKWAKYKWKFLCRDKKGSLDGEIFELLYTLTDFLAFKEMFLDYKNYKDGRCIDLSSSISVTSYKLENDEIEEEFWISVQ